MGEEQQPLSLDPGFIDDVGKHLSIENTEDINVLLNKLQLRYQHLRTAENQVLQQRQRHQQKLQYLKQALDTVIMLIERNEAEEDTIVDYSLASNVYAKARIPPAKSVQLWLGADIMLEYPIEEARGVLQDNHDKCQKALDDNKEAWDQLKDCKTTCEVNIARCHNYDVEKRKKGKGCGAE